MSKKLLVYRTIWVILLIMSFYLFIKFFSLLRYIPEVSEEEEIILEIDILLKESDALLKRFTYLSKKRPLTEEEKKELDALPARVRKRTDKIWDLEQKLEIIMEES